MFYGDAAIRILREMMTEAEQYAGEYLDFSEAEELLEEGERKLHRLENYRDEFVDFGKQMTDLEYNISADLSRVLREQEDLVLSIHTMSNTDTDQRIRMEEMENVEEDLTYAMYQAEIKAEIEAYWNRQDGYFEDGWWKDEEKKQEAFNILLLESLMTENEAGESSGYDLMEHYISTKIRSPKRYALQLMFQLEPTDDDDEAVLNRIAGVCAQNGIDLPGNNWVIPPDIMQLHAVYHKILQTESDNNEKTLLSFMINFTPVIGEVKAVTEALAGKDIITGEELTGVEKILGLAAGFADVLYLLNGLKGIKYADEAEDVVKKIKGGKYSTFGEMSEVDGIKYSNWMKVREGELYTDYVKAGKELATKLEIDGYKILKMEDATVANADWYDMGFDKPPIAERTMAYTVEAGNHSYSRVYLEGYNNPMSTFIVRTDEIEGLNAQEIAEKLALPKVPNRVVEVELPPSTPLEVSITGPQPDWGTIGGDIQFAIKDVDLNPQWFINIRILE